MDAQSRELYQYGIDLTLISQGLGHSNLEPAPIYAHADIEYNWRTMNHALENADVPGVALENYVVTDEELLKRLYGL